MYAAIWRAICNPFVWKGSGQDSIVKNRRAYAPHIRATYISGALRGIRHTRVLFVFYVPCLLFLLFTLYVCICISESS